MVGVVTVIHPNGNIAIQTSPGLYTIVRLRGEVEIEVEDTLEWEPAEPKGDRLFMNLTSDALVPVHVLDHSVQTLDLVKHLDPDWTGRFPCSPASD